MKRLYARFVLWLISPALELKTEAEARAASERLRRAMPIILAAISQPVLRRKE